MHVCMYACVRHRARAVSVAQAGELGLTRCELGLTRCELGLTRCELRLMLVSELVGLGEWFAPALMLSSPRRGE